MNQKQYGVRPSLCLLANIGFHTAGDEPCKVCPLSVYRSPGFHGSFLRRLLLSGSVRKPSRSSGTGSSRRSRAPRPAGRPASTPRRNRPNAWTAAMAFPPPFIAQNNQLMSVLINLFFNESRREIFRKLQSKVADFSQHVWNNSATFNYSLIHRVLKFEVKSATFSMKLETICQRLR